MALPLDSTMNVATEMLSKFGLNAQATYNPIIRDSFYALVPSDFKFYYMNTIRRALQWYQGYVPEVHNPAVGIPATCIGNTIVKEIAKLTTSGDVMFESKYKETSNTTDPDKLMPVNETLTKFNKWADGCSFQDTIKELIEYSAAGGTSAGVAYINEDRDLYLMPYRIDQFFYRVSFSGNVVDYTGFIGFYTAKVDNGTGRKETDANFYLVERRYYKDGKPFMKYAIHRGIGNVVSGLSFDIRDTSEMQWIQLPRSVQKWLMRDFNGIKFGVEQEINFTDDLGVIIMKWTAENRIPEVRMGESVLLNIVAYLQAYEYAEAAMWTDMYLGRGKIIMPEEFRNPSEAPSSFYSGYDSIMFTKYPYKNYNDQKPMSVQFELRAEEWSRVRNNIAEKMAATIGVSGSDIFSYLRDVSGGSKTATQIAAESQKTISYIYEKRSLIKSALRKFVNLWKSYYKAEDDIEIRFSSQNMVNKLVTLEESRVKKEIGYSKFDLFQEQNPDKDDEQIKEMVERSWNEEKKRLEMQAEVQMQAFEQRANANGNPVGDGIEETGETNETEEKPSK